MTALVVKTPPEAASTMVVEPTPAYLSSSAPPTVTPASVLPTPTARSAVMGPTSAPPRIYGVRGVGAGEGRSGGAGGGREAWFWRAMF